MKSTLVLRKSALGRNRDELNVDGFNYESQCNIAM